MDSRRKGAFYGCLIGDALGAPVEFKQRDTFAFVRDMIPCTHFGLPPGSFTDDGSLMLCLAAALLHTGGLHDPYVVLSHYVEWYREGYMSVNGECFDIGRTTRNALYSFIHTEEVVANTSDEHEAGNGSLMRIVPIPLLFGDDKEDVWQMAVQESRTTHANPMATWCCAVWSQMIAMALEGKSKEELLASLRNPKQVPEGCERFATLDFLTKSRSEIKSTGFVVETLEAALWGFFGTSTFEEGLMTVVNLGGDADTIGAVFGSLAGAFYGWEAIPIRWLDALQKREMVDSVWTDFSELCKNRKRSQHRNDESPVTKNDESPVCVKEQ